MTVGVVRDKRSDARPCPARRADRHPIDVGLRAFHCDLLPVALQFQDAKRRRVGLIVERVRLDQTLDVLAGEFGLVVVFQIDRFRRGSAPFQLPAAPCGDRPGPESDRRGVSPHPRDSARLSVDLMTQVFVFASRSERGVQLLGGSNSAMRSPSLTRDPLGINASA